MDHIVTDVEIARTVDEVGGWDHTDRMLVGVAAVWSYRDQRLRFYGPDDVEDLRARLLAADRISTYNGNSFDYPVIWGVPRSEWECPENLRDPIGQNAVSCIKSTLFAKSNDLLARIWQALGCREKGWKLDDVCRATLGVGKIDQGEDAPVLFKAGKWAKLYSYVADDVCLERDLTDFVDTYGFLIGGNGRVLWLDGK